MLNRDTYLVESRQLGRSCRLASRILLGVLVQVQCLDSGHIASEQNGVGLLPQKRRRGHKNVDNTWTIDSNQELQYVSAGSIRQGR